MHWRAPSAEIKPGVHDVHAAALPTLKRPEVHGVHVGAPSGEKRPSAQSVQAKACASPWRWPAGQWLQLACVTTSCTLSSAHGRQPRLPGYWSAGHAEQDVAPAGDAVPLAHAVHSEAADTSL